MTTQNTLLLAALLENNEIAESPALTEFITNTLEAAGKRSTNKANPDKTDEDGQTWKYCTRHEQYEKIEGWKVGTNGRLDQSCDVAVAHWRELTKQLKALEKQIPDHMAVPEDLQNHMIKVESKKAERAGKYEAPANIHETHDVQAEETEVVVPKKRGKK